MRSLTEPKTTIQKYNENISKIFYNFTPSNSKKGVVVRDRLFQEDIFQLMTEKGGDTKMHDIKNAQQISLQAKSSLGIRTFNLNQETNLLQLEE